jgi:hypothetical protein
MPNLYHISFIFGGVPKIRDLEPAFADQEDDWVRMSPFTWLLWSPKPLIVVYTRIKPLLDNDDRFLISRIDNSQIIGFLSPGVWDWINKKLPDSIVEGDEFKKLLPPPSY